jgi:membrane-bound lytic murein transglycosylase B
VRITAALLVLAGIAGAVVWWGLPVARKAGVIGPVVVPTEYRSVIREAAQLCPQVPVRVFAAQISAESSWDPTAVSRAGAQGIAQFMPEVWAQYGIDANGDGVSSVWDPTDAIHSSTASIGGWSRTSQASASTTLSPPTTRGSTRCASTTAFRRTPRPRPT